MLTLICNEVDLEMTMTFNMHHKQPNNRVCILCEKLMCNFICEIFLLKVWSYKSKEFYVISINIKVSARKENNFIVELWW